MENQPKSKSIFKSWWFWTIIVVAWFILFIIRNPQFISSPSKVSDEFTAEFNELNEMTMETKNTALLTIDDMIKEAEEKENKEEYNEALQIANEAIIQINSAADKANLTKIRIGEFKTLANAVEDADIKVSALKVADLYLQMNETLLRFLDYDRQIWKLIKVRDEELVAGKPVSESAEAEVEILTNKINAEMETISRLSDEIIEATQNLNKIAY